MQAAPPPLSGRVALVTGAASGIGRAVARRLAADGAVVGCLDLVPAGLEHTVAAIEADGGRAHAFPADVTDAARVRQAVARLTDSAGPPLVLVNNAGVPGEGSFLETTDGQWQRLLAVHVRGAEGCARAVLPAMLEAGWGRIVTIGSDAAWTGDATVPYATAKAALVGFTRALAREVAAAGVRVNLVAPGPVETPMLLHDSPAHLEAELASVLRGSFLSPEEVAATVAFLCGPAGDAYVGQVLSPNGGTVFT
jgi:NAD(P)-dependent dehydrogenase (short-subunit alcohol dehydrogenase family)